MNKIKLAAVAIGAVGLGLAGASTALAGQSTVGTPTPPPSAGVQGTEAPETPGTAVKPEVAGATEAAEAPGVSDGNDGGHADADGADVNHEGGANEK